MSNDTTPSQSQRSTARAVERPTGSMQVTRTELVWPGKYNEDGTRKEVPRVSLPFQVIETVNESQATRQAKKAAGPTLFDLYEGDEGDTFDTGWKNKLIWGDNLLVMGSLLEKFAGKIDLIYIDPPFATGADFSFTAPIGESAEQIEKEQSAIEEKAYRDTWGAGMDSYLSMMAMRLPILRDLLSPHGTFFLHCDWHMGHVLRCLLDEVFGADSFLNEIVWQRTGAHNDAGKFGVVHDTLLFYSKSPDHVFNPIFVSHSDEHLATRFNQVEEGTGKRFFAGPITAPGSGPPRNFRGKMIAPPNGRHWSYGQAGIDDLEAKNLIYYSSTGTPYLKQYMDDYVAQGRRVQSI